MNGALSDEVFSHGINGSGEESCCPVGKAEAVVSEARGIIEDVRALSRADIATTV
jgi:hypothetical protein